MQRILLFLAIVQWAAQGAAQFVSTDDVARAVNGTISNDPTPSNATNPSDTIAAAKYPFDGWDAIPKNNTASFQKSNCVPTPWSDDERKAGRFPFPAKQGQNDCLPRQQNWYRCLDFPKVNDSVSELPHLEGMPGEGYHYTSEFVRVFLDVFGETPIGESVVQQQQQQQQVKQTAHPAAKYGPFEVHFMETVRPECYELQRKVNEGSAEVFSIYHGQYVAAISEANVGMMARSPAIPLVESGKGTLHFKVQGIRLVASSLPKNKCFINTKLKGHKPDPTGKTISATFTYDAVKILDMPPKVRDEYMRKHNITMEYLMKQEKEDEEHRKAIEKRNQLREELKKAGFTPGWTGSSHVVRKKAYSGSYSYSAGAMPLSGPSASATVDAAMANTAALDEHEGDDFVGDAAAIGEHEGGEFLGNDGEHSSRFQGRGIGAVSPSLYEDQSLNDGYNEDFNWEGPGGSSYSLQDEDGDDGDMSYANPRVRSDGSGVSVDEDPSNEVLVEVSEASPNTGHSCVVYGDGPNGTANIHFEVTVPLDLPSLIEKEEQISYLDASVLVVAINPTEPCILRLAVKYDSYRQGYGIVAAVFMLPPQNSGEGRPALLMK